MRLGIGSAATALVATAAIVAIGFGRGDGATTPAPTPAAAEPQRTDAQEPGEAATTSPAPTPAPAARDPEQRRMQLELPDGTFVPMLNGATGALSLRECWGARPWSPIVRVNRTDLGVDWYVHADGTQTTTVMKWRPDLGRDDAMTRIAVPKREAPPVKPRR